MYKGDISINEIENNDGEISPTKTENDSILLSKDMN